MKKKLLSLLLSLAMVLTLLPVSAMAADLTDDQKDALTEALLAQEYTEEEIAELLAEDKVLVIDEDTELEEDFDGLILVVGGCTVTIKGAKIGAGVVILPGAEEAKVVLTEKTEVKAVVVLEKKAEVVVEAEAKVVSIVVGAPEAVVTVEGSAEELTVSEDAEGAEVTVSGTVETLTVEAPKTTVAVEAGAKVDAVVVGEKAEGTEITVSEDAEMGEIKDENGNAAVTEEPAKTEEDVKKPVEDTTEDVFLPDFIFLPIIPDTPVDDGGGSSTGGGTCCNGNDTTDTGSFNTTAA